MFIEAYDETRPGSSANEPLILVTSLQEDVLMHHGLAGNGSRDVDKPTLEVMAAEGWIDIDYATSNLSFVPTPYGRSFVESSIRVDTEEALADVAPIVTAINDQDEAENRFAWGHVSETLGAIRNYWDSSGFPATGIALPAIYAALEDDQARLLGATVSRLYEGAYFSTRHPQLHSLDAPAEVILTEKAFQALDGWPGGSNIDMAVSLIAAIGDRAGIEGDPEKRSKLESLGKTAKEIGVETISEIVAKIATSSV